MLERVITRKDALLKRKSVRSYRSEDEKIIPREIEARFYDAVSGFVPVLSGARPTFEIKTHEEMERLFPSVTLNAKAPYYLVVCTDTAKEHAYVDAGRFAHALNIELTSYGFGTCYQGMARVKKAARDRFEQPFAIALAFGWAKDDPYRKDAADATRKGLDELVVASTQEPPASPTPASMQLNALLESARLAPSALNKQPWRFVVDGQAIHVWRTKQVALLASLTGMDHLQQIDVGICLMQMELFAQENGVPFRCSRQKTDPAPQPKGCLYEATVELFKL